jgi:hypothetical protein
MFLKPAGWILAMVSALGLLWAPEPMAYAKWGRHAHAAMPVSAAGSTYAPAPRGFGTVKAALSQFDYALAMHDVGMLQVAGVDDASAKLWDRFFSENPDATVTDDCPASKLFVAEDTAKWTCTETVTIISEGKPLAFLHVIRFTFGRNHGVWKVADRTVRQRIIPSGN